MLADLLELIGDRPYERAELLAAWPSAATRS